MCIVPTYIKVFIYTLTNVHVCVFKYFSTLVIHLLSFDSYHLNMVMQSKFFETFAAPFTKRGLLLKFLILGGGSTLAYLSSTATGDVLPIKKGPQLPPQLGPRGKI